MVNDILFARDIILNELQQKILKIAYHFLNQADVSYAYGGNKIGTLQECEQCAKCLEDKTVVPSKQELFVCPVCERCSIDCSHFVQLVFKNAGIYYPYLSTQMMIDFNDEKLYKEYGFINLRDKLNIAQPADLLVYNGHVAILTKLHTNKRGDIIHATRGRHISGLKGEGIQLEHNVDLLNFKGPVLKILRHKKLLNNISNGKSLLKPTKSQKDLSVINKDVNNQEIKEIKID